MEEKGPVGSTDVVEDEEAKFRERVREEEAARPKKVKPRIPPEITGAFLAGLTVLLTVPQWLPQPWQWLLPPWAIFITWAGYFAAGGGGPGKTAPVLKLMYPCIVWGAFWGLVAVLAFSLIPSSVPLWQNLLLSGIVIFLVNQPILWGSKFIKVLHYTPAHFYGFGTFFSVYFAGFGLLKGDPYIAFLSGVAMNLLGPIFGYLQVALSFPKGEAEMELPPGKGMK